MKILPQSFIETVQDDIDVPLKSFNPRCETPGYVAEFAYALPFVELDTSINFRIEWVFSEDRTPPPLRGVDTGIF
jgi:hypothetical protein